MTFDYLPYAVTEGFLILYGIAILYRLNLNFGSENEVRELRRIIYAFFVVLVTDIFWAMVEDGVIVPGDWTNTTVNAVSISAVAAGCYYWYKFVSYRLGAKVLDNKKTAVLVAIPLVADVTLIMLSIFTGWVFYIDGKGHYSYGPLFFVQASVCYGYLVVPTVRALKRAFTERTGSRRGEYVLYASYMVLPLISGVIEDFIPTVPILYLCMFMVIHILFLTLQDQQVNNDALTGLQNRRSLNLHLEERLATASEKRPVTVYMMDLNSFKSINDTYGHIEGDYALRLAAEALRRTAARYGAFAARYGGDEFCLVYTGLDYDAAAIAQRLKAELRAVQTEQTPRRPYVLSLSIGWESFLAPQSDFMRVLDDVDARLYADKRRWNAKLSG